MKTALITGANGSVGLGICEQLLKRYSIFNQEIRLLLLCRSENRGKEAKAKLIQTCNIPENDEKSKELIQVLICDLSLVENVLDELLLVKSICDQLIRELTSIDMLFLNAGVMPTDGLDLGAGLFNLFTRPGYLAKTGGDVMKQSVGLQTETGLGLVFACNVLGHYIMTRKLVPLLSKSKFGARVIWCSSTTAIKEFFNPDDWQCLTGTHPYESSKRLCELVSMNLYPELAKHGIYSFYSSPGNVISNISTSQASESLVLFSLYMMRFFGCSGVNITGSNGATSAVWLACHSDPKSIDPNTLYHSDITMFGETWVKQIPSDATVEDLKIASHIMKQMTAKLS